MSATNGTAMAPDAGIPPSAHVEAFSLVAGICGWFYFVAWSLAFYPQCLLNFKLKSVRGLSLDYVLLNLTGFFCYSLFTLLLNYSAETREAFTKHHGIEPPVEFNDTIFAVHGFVLCVVTALQCLIYERGEQKLSFSALGFNSLLWVLLGGLSVATFVFDVDHNIFILYLGLSKVLCSFFKYIPQVMSNYKRKSTSGWALHFTFLDLSGGIFSLIQQLIRSLQTNSMKPFTANVAKTGLAVETLIFDSMFLVQHFFLYAGNEGESAVDEDEDRLWLHELDDGFDDIRSDSSVDEIVPAKR